MSFGWYHEAYIDNKGQLFVCAKASVPSIKIIEVPDGIRETLTLVTSLPKGSKTRQVAFTRTRMFVLTEDGKLFVFKVIEKPVSLEDRMFARGKPRFTGELIL